MAVYLVYVVALALICVNLHNVGPRKVTAQDDDDDNDGPPPTVILKQGSVSGVVQKADDCRKYNAFMGIPYGTVPGRFMPPEPAGMFPPGFVANESTQYCIQNMAPLDLGVVGVEDCLTLEVYTPHLPKSEDDRKLPVMVFIYPGMFQFGSASETTYGPNHLMTHDVILVVINYRVGVFGFLATGDSSSPGNYGLLDQNLALVWVRNNIAQFGGDNNQVTIFGEDAGAASVGYHMLSPLSAGLFQGVIMMSGWPLCPWALSRNPLQTARFVADLMECPPITNTQEIIDCLRNISAEKLAAPLISVGPVVEPISEGLFLTENPYKLLAEGRFNKVPVISGKTLEESAFQLLYSVDPNSFNVSKDEFLNNRFVDFFKFALRADNDFAKMELDKIQALGQEYFGQVNFDNETDLNIANIQSDAGYGSCNDLTIKLLTDQNLPVYSYVFEYFSDVSDLTYNNLNGKPDVVHESDLFYLFGTPKGSNGRNYSDEAILFLKKYVTLWTNFATVNHPTPAGSPFNWKPCTPYSEIGCDFLRIGEDMEMDVDPYPRRTALWNNLLQQFMKFQLNRN